MIEAAKHDRIRMLLLALALALPIENARAGGAYWDSRDYVDLYFIIRDHYSIPQISAKAREIFGPLFQSAQFLEQLAYHEDINYSEQVEYLIPSPPADEEVKRFLIEKAIED